MEVIVKGQPAIEIGFETKTVDSYKTVDSALSTTSENPVKNKVVTAELGKKATKTELSALETKVTDNKTATDKAVSDLSAKVDEEVESLHTQLDSHDVAIEDLQDNKVDKGDYAPALTSGFADNLVSKDIVVDSEFNVRQSGNGAISDGVARMEVVKGNSVVWNQLIKNGTFADLSYWSTATNSNVTVTVEDGVATMTFEGTTGNRYNQDIRQSVAIYANHKYFFAVDVYSDDVNICHIILYTPTGSKTATHNMQLGQWNHASGITTMVAEASGSALFRIGTVDKIGQATMKFKNVSFYDLTLMYGAGNEPTTVEEFYTRCPQNIDMGAYNAGEVIHCNVDAVKSVGRNVWDEEWEVGHINTDGVNANGTGQIRSKNYIRVIPNSSYHYGGPQSCVVVFYDQNKKIIGDRLTVNVNKTFTTPANCVYIRFFIIVYPYNNNICINISDPDFNGQYEPYREDVRELPSAIKAAFPEGMMSAGSANDVAYNDLNKGVGVTEKRMGVIDLGTLNWLVGTVNNGGIRFYATLDTYVASWEGEPFRALCEKYQSRSPKETYYQNIGVSNNNIANRPQVMVYDPSYTDASTFKAAMSGVKLVYELTTPVITEHDEPFNLDYEVTNGGQEQAIATNPTAPFKAEIAYGFNASAKIKENANEIENLKAIITQLQAAIASMVSTTTEEVE